MMKTDDANKIQISHHDRIFELIYSKTDEIMWQGILYELVRSEKMDPWDVDVSILTKKYLETIKQLKEHDFRISGKVILAAAILLKIKSEKLVGEDFDEFTKLITSLEEQEEDEAAIFDDNGLIPKFHEIPTLIPRTPQPRKRKVSIFDLVKALQKALEVKKRRVLNSIPPMDMEIPKKKKEITEVIRDVYGKIKSFFMSGKTEKLTFSNLLPSSSKEDKVYTFIPLLHLSQQNKVELIQNEPFGEIEVVMIKQA